MLSNKVPTYLADDIRLASESSTLLAPSGSLRAENALSLVFTVVLVTCFAAAGPRIWNNLPAGLHCKTMKSAAQNSEDN